MHIILGQGGMGRKQKQYYINSIFAPLGFWLVLQSASSSDSSSSAVSSQVSHWFTFTGNIPWAKTEMHYPFLWCISSLIKKASLVCTCNGVSCNTNCLGVEMELPEIMLSPSQETLELCLLSMQGRLLLQWFPYRRSGQNSAVTCLENKNLYLKKKLFEQNPEANVFA